MNLSILRAAKSDVPKILELSNWAAEKLAANFALEPESLDHWMQAFDRTQNTHPWLVAKSGEELLGFAKASPHHVRGGYAWAADVSVYVRPQLHRQGIGTRLYERLVPLMRAQGYVALLAVIAPPNPPSERLHAAFGFSRCGTFHRVGWKFGRWHDIGHWELHLQGDGPPSPLRSVDAAWQTVVAD